MPVRKSHVSTASNEELSKAVSKETKDDDRLSVEDLNLPKSMVQRLAKGVLPPNTQIQRDALLAMSKSATVFVNYITSQAAENAQRHNKKTVMPPDVFAALTELEFDSFLPRLEAEVQKFTSIQADKRNTYRKKVREEKKAAKDKVPEHGGAHNESPPTKRARRSSMDNGEHNDGSDDEEGVDAGEQGDQDDEVEDDEVEEEEGLEAEGLTEDLLEEKEDQDDDDEMADGDESD